MVLNAKKMNFDGKLDFSVLSSDVTVYDTTEQQLSERIHGADIIVTKEMPVSAEMIQNFPESVKLICEAGQDMISLFLHQKEAMSVTFDLIVERGAFFSVKKASHNRLAFLICPRQQLQNYFRMKSAFLTAKNS